MSMEGAAWCVAILLIRITCENHSVQHLLESSSTRVQREIYKKYVHISQINSYSSNVYVPKKQEGRMVGKTHTGSREGNKVNEKCRVKNGS